MDLRVKKWLLANPGKRQGDAPWYEFVRNSLFAVFKWHISLVVLLRTMCDVIAIVYAYFISLLIQYVYDPNA